LVNGTPPIVNVDDIQLLPKSAMENNPQFKALREQYPRMRLSVEADQRKADMMPEIQPLGGGSQRFLIDYGLKEPCQACPAIAHATFGFDFDSTGKFQGAKFVKIIPVDH
jgi:hypothetical protein